MPADSCHIVASLVAMCPEMTDTPLQQHRHWVSHAMPPHFHHT